MDFSWPARVYYEDTDAAGVVYHSRYLHFMERARTEWLRAIGMEQQALAEQTGVRFTITRMEIDFLAPARLDDLLQITVHLSKPGRASLTLEQRILREPDRCLMARAIVRVACIDSHFRPTRLPTPLKHLPRGEHTP